MGFKFGMHVGVQYVSYQDLKRLWQMADKQGFEFVSTWDHFYADPAPDEGGPCFEAISMLASLANVTQNVRIGALALCVGYRHPTVIANAAASIDHISNGRFELGLGAGWLETEYNDYCIEFPPIGTRLDMLEESVQIIDSMLTNKTTSFSGKHFSVQNAKCDPKPVQEHLPIWICGGGEKRTLKLAAKYANAWNVPYISPEDYKHKINVLNDWCEKEKRDPDDIFRTINVGFYMGSSTQAAVTKQKEFEALYGERVKTQGPGMLLGTKDKAIDRINEYIDAGAQGLNIVVRAPFDWESIQVFQEDVIPAFK